MRRHQKLSKLFRDLAELLDDEASKNPGFADRLNSLVSPTPAPSNALKPRKPRQRASLSIPDVLSALQTKGDEEFRFWLRSLDLPTLRAIVKSNGFDVARVSQRWTDPDKFTALIAEQTAARLKRGSGFLPPPTGSGSKMGSNE